MERLTLTPAEAASLMGISKPLVYAEIHREDGIPHLRVGRKILIPRDKFLDWLEKRTQLPGQLSLFE